MCVTARELIDASVFPIRVDTENVLIVIHLSRIARPHVY